MSSRPPPKPEKGVFYLDRNLGKHVIADAMRANGLSVEVHDDHLPIDAPDEDWIALVGKRRWIALTKDKNIRYRYAEIDAVKKHRARVIVIRAKNTTGDEIAALLVQHAQRIQRYVAQQTAPLIAGIDRSGKITRYAA